MLDPFEGKPPIVETLWNVLKNFSYILLVFSALLAAYDWLFGREDQAKRAIFNIIIVALVINFTFVLIEEAFKIVRVFELGITNNQINKIGDLIAASFWQENPIKVFSEITAEFGGLFGGGLGVKPGLLRFVFYIFIIVFDILTIIVLVATILIFVVRYIKLIILTSVSSLATASILLPEFKGPLGEATSQFRFFDAWFGNLIKWLIVVPIFVMMVIIGGAVMKNVLDFSIANLSTESEGLTLFVRFITLFIIALAWYVMSLKVADNLSGGLASRAKKWVIGALSGIGVALGGLALGGLGGFAGRTLTTMGKGIASKVGTGGLFGWRSWVNRAIGGKAVEIGQKILEKRYGFDITAATERIKDINEQLRKTTDPAQIQNLTSQLSQLIQKYKGNNYVLKSINESLRGLSPESAAKILTQQPFLQMMTDPQTSPETKEAIAELIKKVSGKDADTLISMQAFLQAAAGQQAPEVIREATAGLIDKLRKSNFKTRMNDVNWVQGLQNLSQEFINAVADRIEKDFKEGDAIDFMRDNARINAIHNLPQLRDRLNRASKGLLEAVINQNVNAAADALSSFGKNFWQQEHGISNTIHQILQNQGFSQADIENILLGAIENADEETQEAILLRARSDSGPVRSTLRNLFRPPRVLGPTGQLVLTPQQQRAQNIMQALSGRNQAIINAL
jgi:hypothetical protein